MGQVAVDLKETKSILEAFDMPKPRSIVQEFAGQMHKRLQDTFPGPVSYTHLTLPTIYSV